MGNSLAVMVKHWLAQMAMDTLLIKAAGTVSCHYYYENSVIFSIFYLKFTMEDPMSNMFFRRLFRKQRKYPIKRDEFGKSARRRAFKLFDKGERPSKVAPQVGISPRTAYRYFEDWKKLPRKLEEIYPIIRRLLKQDPDFPEGIQKEIADALGVPVEDLKARLEEPWGARRLMLGRLKPKEKMRPMKKEHLRLDSAFNLIGFFEESGVPLERLKKMFMKTSESLRCEAKKLKEGETCSQQSCWFYSACRCGHSK